MDSVKVLAILLTVACSSDALTPQHVKVASQPFPVGTYPPGAHIYFPPSLTNAEMDCRWGFFCDGGVPNFHFRTQDDLHRIDGWAEFAGVRRHDRMVMAFEIFVSRYSSVSDETGAAWSERAFLDLEMALSARRYLRNERATNILRPQTTGGTLLAVQLLGKQDLVVMALWSGSLEIEAIALYDHRPSTARQTAWASLARQVHLAADRGV